MSRPKDPPTEWAASVRSSRLAAGMTQASLAVLLQLAASTVYRIEQGHVPSEEIRVRIDKWLKRVRKAAA